MHGAPLRELLQSKNACLALRGALMELHRLHSTKVRFPCGTLALWSHGDPHSSNVFFDVETGRARWFDFESVHDLRQTDARRHADDLQTLLFSAAVYLPENHWPEMVQLARDIYADNAIWREIYDDLQRLESWPNIVHLGHTHLTRQAHARFLQLLKTT